MPQQNNTFSQGSEKLKGRYANYFEVGHNEFECIIDFGQSFKDDEDLRMHTRIITSPASLKALIEVLEKSIHEHELRKRSGVKRSKIRS